MSLKFRIVRIGAALLAAGAASLLPDHASADGLRGGFRLPDNEREWIGVVPELSRDLLDWTADPNGTALKLLRGRRDGTLRTGRGYVHAQIQGARMVESTNVAGRFPILSRLPNQHGDGTENTEDVIHRGQLAATAALPFVTLFGEGVYTETLYRDDDRWDVRRLFAVVGDLDRFPVYLKLGRDFVDFGHMGATNPFLPSMNWHYFHTQSDAPVVSLGYAVNGLEASATWIPEGRHKRVAASDGPNFALDASIRKALRPGIEVELGGGYLHDTIYDTRVPHHLVDQRAGQDAMRNGAVNVRGGVTVEAGAVGRFETTAEFTRTLEPWPATNHAVSAFTVQGRWSREVRGVPVALSASYGRGVQGAPGTEWERMEQFTLGAEVELTPLARLQAEYVFNTGFAPLIAITRASDASVEAHGWALGATLGF